MSRVLPILFNTDMVRAILDGRKTVTRREVKYKYSNTEMKMRTDKYGTRLIEIQKSVEGETYGQNPDGSKWHKLLGYVEPKPPYKKGDILYVRESYCPNYFDECLSGYRSGDNMRGNRNAYKADYHKEIVGDVVPEPKWKPSIHMPKEAARIWLKVTDVRVERLWEITEEQAYMEGTDPWDEACYANNGWRPTSSDPDSGGTPNIIDGFHKLWNATLKKSDLYRYGWDANPYVFVIEFERCEKPSAST